MQSGYDSLWESFPHILESLEGTRRYISAFRAPFQELSALSLVQIHTLRACSLLAIPPPPERVPPQGGFPTDLSELNLSGWAALVQDMVAGLQVLPPNLGCDMGLPAVALLQLLEASTGVGFCHYCCSPGSWCKCRGASQPVPPVSWSQIVEQTPGYGVIASSGGMTTPSTSVAGMAGYVVPLPGLPPPLASQGLSHIGRSIQVRATAERQAWAQLAQGPRVWCHAHHRWCHLSVSNGLAGCQLRTNRQCSCQASPPGGESHLTPPWIKLPPLPVKAQKTTGGRGLGSGEMMANPPVTLGCKKRQGGSCLVRRVISPPGQHQMFPQPQHLREPRLSWVVSQGPYPVIPHGWPPDTLAQDGRRTLSMCSRSTTSITLPPIRRQGG